MAPIRKKEDLLDRLQRELGCAYLSDVKRYGMDTVCKQLAQIQPEEYSLTDWAEAFVYLTGQQKLFQSYAELKEYLSHTR